MNFQPRPLKLGLKWGILSIFLSAIFAPVWLEIGNFTAVILEGRRWHGFFNAIDPILYLGGPLFVLIYLSIPLMLGSVILSTILYRSKYEAVGNNRMGLAFGSAMGFIIGIVSTIITIWWVSGGRTEYSDIGDFVSEIIWGIWSVLLFGFIGWRMSNEVVKSSITRTTSDPYQ
jgi:hypothetical protein